MQVTASIVFRVFLSAVIIASLVDMYTVQLLKDFGGLSRKLAARNLRRAYGSRIFRFLIGDTTLSYMKSRTLLFPMLELLFVMLVLTSLYTHGFSFVFMRTVLFLIIALPLAVVDWLTLISPNLINYPGAVIGILTAVYLGPKELASCLLGGIIFAGTLWFMGWAWERARGVEAMGRGTIKTAFMIGTFGGWKLAILTLFLGVLTGSVYGIILVVRRGRQDFNVHIPFDSFLLACGFVSMLWGNPLVSWYLGQLAAN